MTDADHHADEPDPELTDAGDQVDQDFDEDVADDDPEEFDDGDFDDDEDDEVDDDEVDDDEVDDDEVDDDYIELEANKIPAPHALGVLEYLVTSVVDDPDGVEVDADDRRGRSVSLEVRVAPGDMGRVIGKRGRVANAIRSVVRAAAVRDDVNVDIEFED